MPGDSIKKLKETPEYFHFIEEAYMHCKGLAFDEGTEDLLKLSNIKIDKGVIEYGKELDESFINVLKKTQGLGSRRF